MLVGPLQRICIVAALLDAYRIAQEPYYRPSGREVELYAHAYAHRLPLILKGPTGCGKTRFVEYLSLIHI